MIKYSDIPEEKKLEVKKYIGEIGSEHISRVVVEKVKEKFNVIIDDRSVRYILQRIRESLDQVGETLEKAIEAVNEQEEKKYEIFEKEGELCYKLDAGKSIFVIPVKEIDAMFKDYSNKWANLTGEQMRQKYSLKPQAWATIKNRLSLVKDSHIYSPYTLENSSEEEVDAMIEKGIEEHIDTKIGKFVNTYEKQFKKRADIALKEKANFEYRLKKLREVLETYKPEKIDFVPNYVPNGSAEHFFLTDIHIGKIDTEGIKRRFGQMYQDIIACKSNTIHITCLGDLVETMCQDGMHNGQIIYGTDPKYWYGFELAMNTTTIFEEWLTAIAKSGKKIYFKGLPWNHDRIAGKNDDDLMRSGGLFIYEMLKLRVERLGIEVEYFKEDINVFFADGIQYIVWHWEWPMGRQKAPEIIVEYATIGKYTILASWHTHALQMSEWKNYTKLVIPALAGKWNFDKKMNLHSEAGYIQIKKNAYDTADIFIKRLK